MKRYPALALAGLFLATSAFAGGDDAIEKALKDREGKSATVVLHSGNELTGTVAKVGGGVVTLTQLSGKDFYDAVVNIDDVQAVVMKVRNQ